MKSLASNKVQLCSSDECFQPPRSASSRATPSDGKLCRVRYRKPDRTQTDKRGFRIKRDAELFLAATEVRKATGEFIGASAASITINEIGGAWLSSQAHLMPSSPAVTEVA